MMDGSQGAPEVTPDLRLRPERPRVTRLSRKVLIGLGGVSSLAIAGALIYALQTRNTDQSAKELYSIENRPTADGLTGLPRDYTGIPKLGPPLPGDLGRPILSAQNQGQSVPAGRPLPQPGVTPEEQRRLQEIEAARLSKLFAATAIRLAVGESCAHLNRLWACGRIARRLAEDGVWWWQKVSAEGGPNLAGAR